MLNIASLGKEYLEFFTKSGGNEKKNTSCNNSAENHASVWQYIPRS